MRPEEVAAFLAGQTRAVVVALDDEGRPRGAVGRLVDRGGGSPQEAVGFVLQGDDPVVALLACDPRACCVAEHFPSYYGIQGVMLHGHAHPVEPADRADAEFELSVERVVSYDFGKLLAD